MKYLIVLLLCLISPLAYGEERFEKVSVQHFGSSLWVQYATVLRDKQTGVEYLFFKSGYGAGLCKLESSPAEKLEEKNENKIVDIGLDDSGNFYPIPR